LPTPQPTPLPEGAIRRALDRYGLTATHAQVEQISAYLSLLLVWNEKLNITSIRDPREILFRHFCESMFAHIAVRIEKGRLADVGSGGGFPGLPLKIISPELEVFLIESNTKKATFLAEVVRTLGLTGVRVMVQRYEELGEEIAPLDFVCTRALGDLDRLLAWAASPVVAAKSVVLWVGASDTAKLMRQPGWSWRAPVPVPDSLRRVLLVGDRLT
jgi:16S rRNA (guanine527-N7)-methyltransferase